MEASTPEMAVVERSGERVLDVSTLEPPEPLVRALEAIEALERGQFLRMLHRREPLLLFETLEKRGYRYSVGAGRHTAFEILIWNGADCAAERAARAVRAA
jgi:hypothetical protein